ncbi:MAG: hypothetical protein ACFFD4_03825, partial [Candidatus Odinarchaeota archaeon]
MERTGLLALFIINNDGKCIFTRSCTGLSDTLISKKVFSTINFTSKGWDARALRELTASGCVIFTVKDFEEFFLVAISTYSGIKNDLIEKIGT